MILNAVTVLMELFIVNLVLSGDNAIIIALATKNLDEKIKKKASLWGTLLAIGLRIIFIIIIIIIGEMHLILVNLIAGLLLLKIALDLLNQQEEVHNIKSQTTMIKAIKTILIADIVMSLDNAIVIAAIAEKSVGGCLLEIIVIVIALLMSFPIILFGANILNKFLQKYQIIIYLCVFVLVHTAINLMINDYIFNEITLQINSAIVSIIVILLSILIMGIKIKYENSKKIKEDK